jgi:hypothetical protein
MSPEGRGQLDDISRVLAFSSDHCSWKHDHNPLFVCPAVIDEWQKRGGQPWQLIEPVDGFHPNEVSTVTKWLLKAVCVFFNMLTYVCVYFYLLGRI